MKSARVIQQHLDELRIAVDVPCDCSRHGHSESCRIGGMVCGRLSKYWSGCCKTALMRLAERMADQATMKW